MRTAAVLPVKRFSDAKQRLSLSIAGSHKPSLVRAMVADVLAVIGSVPEIEMTVVVTREQAAAAAARASGALIVEDSEQGQSAAVEVGIAAALESGAERVLCIPGDCPALDPAELAELLKAHASPVVVIPDRHLTGTNGLLLAPPRVIAPSFGPGSCARHQELARGAGVACEIATPPSLLLDIDTGADLQALRSRLAGESVHAPRTRAILASIDEQPWEASHSAA
jgi:2-phospho-L-lactate/phosphoenolpyruvate guanylyltransferase